MSKITVSFQPTAAGSHWSGDTAYLRIYYYGSRPEAFSFSTGEMWSPSLETFYREVACTLASNVVTIPTTILDSTPDITNRPDVFVRMVLVDSARSEDGAILLCERWDIPIALGSNVTFEQLRIHNETPVTRYDDRASLSRTAIEELVEESMDFGGPATTTALGRVKMTTTPADAANPKAVSDTDPRVKIFDPRSPAYGAVCDGSTNDTAALLAAVAALNANGGGTLVIPESTAGMLVGGAAVANYIANITVPCIIRGHGPRSVLLVKSDTPATTDVFRVTPPPHVGNAEALLNFPEDNSGYVFENFVIKPQSGTPGRDGIRVDITTVGSFFQNSFIRGLQIGDLGGHSLSLLNTGGVNNDGIFNNFVYENIFHGGVYSDALGDSNHFLRNRFWSSVDATHRAFDITILSGAGANEFVGNNITMKLAAKIGGGTGTVFAFNYVEPFRPGSAGADGACVSFDGGELYPKIIGNTFNGALNGNTLNGIHLGNCVGATVDGNNFAAAAAKYGINVSASSTGATISAAQFVTGAGSLMNDLGTGTNTYNFSSSGGRVTRLGTAFGTALGATEIFNGFSVLNPAVLEINQNATVSADSNFAALVLGTKQTGTANLVGGIYFVNPSLAALDKRVALITASTQGVTDSGRLDFATYDAGTRTVKLSLLKDRLNIPLAALPAYANNAAAVAAGRNAGDVYRSGGDPDVLCVVH